MYSFEVPSVDEIGAMSSADLEVCLRVAGCRRVTTAAEHPCRVRHDNPQPCGRHLYVPSSDVMYTFDMDVAVTELRAHLGRWIDAAREGDDIVITDRGTPVARIVALDSTPVIDRLTAQGIISRPSRPTRPVAGDRRRPTPKRPVADIVSEQRR